MIPQRRSKPSRGVIARYDARIVIALGDNFHDGGGPARLAATDRAHLHELQRGRDWVWIAGNHDPDPREGIGGVFARALALGPLSFRHEPTEGGGKSSDFGGEISGHLHPAARIHQRGRTQTRKCFATDSERLVMPAFGAFTGGLNIRNAAFLNVFGALGFTGAPDRPAPALQLRCGTVSGGLSASAALLTPP